MKFKLVMALVDDEDTEAILGAPATLAPPDVR